MDDTFVIGDVHGHLDRLEALLKQEGLLKLCDQCDGNGTIQTAEKIEGGQIEYRSDQCKPCYGFGHMRDRPEVTVIQLGDLGHFGRDGSPTADVFCLQTAVLGWIDLMLWGNHDRALIDPVHTFTGHIQNREALHYLKHLQDKGKLKLAHVAHGFLITHAGLAQAFKAQKVDQALKDDPDLFAEWMNVEDDKYLKSHGEDADPQATSIRDAISVHRGGHSNTGGVLWRDINEKLYDGFRQIFGHSADPKNQVCYCWKNGRERIDKDGPFRDDASYCVDIGGKPGRPGNDCLAGIWLPSEKIVRVDL